MAKARFRTELIEGHKGVTALIVPFDPEAVWRRKPFKLAGRRHGWLVKGTANGARFVGYIGERWGRFFLTVEASLREASGAAVGTVVTVVLEPTETREAFFLAWTQSEATTQPKKGRSDAIAFAD
jgi:hypothetical protein